MWSSSKKSISFYLPGLLDQELNPGPGGTKLMLYHITFPHLYRSSITIVGRVKDCLVLLTNFSQLNCSFKIWKYCTGFWCEASLRTRGYKKFLKMYESVIKTDKPIYVTTSALCKIYLVKFSPPNLFTENNSWQFLAFCNSWP